MNTNIAELDLSNQDIKSFDEIDWTLYPNLEVLYLDDNKITSFEHCPKGIQILYLYNNRITSFEHCPNSIQELNLYNNQITSFKHCPKGIRKLSLYNNQITSFKHCPNSIQKLGLENNQITSFEHLNPTNLTWLDLEGNPVIEEYKNLNNHQILNKIKKIDEIKMSDRAKCLIVLKQITIFQPNVDLASLPSDIIKYITLLI